MPFNVSAFALSIFGLHFDSTSLFEQVTPSQTGLLQLCLWKGARQSRVENTNGATERRVEITMHPRSVQNTLGVSGFVLAVLLLGRRLLGLESLRAVHQLPFLFSLSMKGSWFGADCLSQSAAFFERAVPNVGQPDFILLNSLQSCRQEMT